MRILAILVILALATPASAQCPEALPSLEKQVKELEAALERAKRGEIDVERPAHPPPADGRAASRAKAPGTEKPPTGHP